MKKVYIFQLVVLALLLMMPLVSLNAETTTSITSEGPSSGAQIVGVFVWLVYFIYFTIAVMVLAPVFGFGLMGLVYSLIGASNKEGKDKTYLILKGSFGLLIGIGSLIPLAILLKPILIVFAIILLIGLIGRMVIELMTDRNIFVIILSSITTGVALIIYILVIVGVIQSDALFYTVLIPIVFAIPLNILSYMLIKKRRFL